MTLEETLIPVSFELTKENRMSTEEIGTAKMQLF
jgi:hypothetical protein